MGLSLAVLLAQHNEVVAVDIVPTKSNWEIFVNGEIVRSR